MHRLGQDAWQLIASHLPFKDRRRLALLSKEFCALSCGPGLQWAELELDGYELPSAGEQAAALADLFAALPGVPQLRIVRSSAVMPPETLCASTVLTALRVLRADIRGPLPTTHLAALAVLPLQSLRVALVRTLDGSARFQGPVPDALTRLTGLLKLALKAPYPGDAAGGAMELPAGISAWRQMTTLRLQNLGLRVLPGGIGALTALEQLLLGHNVLGEAELPDSLTQLTRLRRLELQYNAFQAGLPSIIAHKTSLEELNVAGNPLGGETAGLPPEFGRLGRLRYLTLTNCGLAALPPAVAGLTGLVLLKLNLNRLQNLPAGPYLRSIQMLDLAHNPFSHFPPVLLTAAPALTGVSFTFDGAHYTNPALAAQHAPPPATLLQAPPLVPAVAAALAAPDAQ